MRASFVILVLSLIALGAMEICNAGKLKMKYYQKRCRSAETIVRDITYDRVAANPSLAAKLLRLHYHDCFVRGCDASVLLNSTAENRAEISAPPNRSLGGLEVIDEIKKKIEEECPGVVSCADIVALSARDAVSSQMPFKKAMWPVFTGRKDGRISLASEVSAGLPSANANFTTLLEQFKTNGLDIVDLVALSGAHTIGLTRCALVTRRLYNFTGKGDVDPSLNPTYVKDLRKSCPNNPPTPSTILEMDPGSSLSFDSHYYVALNQKKGIFRSDAALLDNRRSAFIAKVFEDPRVFANQFAKSMKKMGDIGAFREGEQEIRKNCRVVNTYT